MKEKEVLETEVHEKYISALKNDLADTKDAFLKEKELGDHLKLTVEGNIQHITGLERRKRINGCRNQRSKLNSQISKRECT